MTAVGMERVPYDHKLHIVENENDLLYADMEEFTQIDRVQPYFDPRSDNIMYAFVDMTFVTRTRHGVLEPHKVRNFKVKTLKGQPRLDSPAELGKNQEWYEIYMWRSAAFRVVATAIVFTDDEIKEVLACAAAGTPINPSAQYVQSLNETAHLTAAPAAAAPAPTVAQAAAPIPSVPVIPNIANTPFGQP